MTRLTNYYNELCADYSKPGLVSDEQVVKLLNDAEIYISQQEQNLPEITSEYSTEQIQQENKDWWPTHCEAIRQGRGDILKAEYRDDLVFFSTEGIFYGRIATADREINLWAILAQPGVTTAWPIVLFNGEAIYTEWNCFDDMTKEIIAKGSETILRRGHRGGCYLKSKQLNFYRNILASDELLHWIRR
ncbi:hypothetical protein G7B40_002655 [Aetokthonos hydrillicola Thurmond2011]|jgi:hypothetical protein|uniref:Uncharacterized protein n=1 Tax=Aetokthonos hydrillicola Thurmond2011 TaxID=2712845 RepID=A0AAP5I2B4_9CYAN|nr:hypothetical protein [Aetokthonos hydrillicola]MBO3459420.1 hypothetical protein [Aetokthonos hydrillicola CCALA 1050]MBW4586566.1 hypothetical protein [Aetokthonos hydrillicola CCALA 1050]MDR9893489.1 hypothetical protein [Aetokthonos hydrillicola Thurmond2011]